ncbi:MAG: hypothetical protein AAGI89_12875 [Pseudomonadota bacterium]
MRIRSGVLVVIGLVLAGCERDTDLGLPLCDSVESAPGVAKIIEAREAMNVAPSATGDPTIIWESVCIRLSSVEPVALETGAWSETVGDDNYAAGSYAAIWHNTDAGWQLGEALKTVEGCAGSLCP